MDKDTNIKKAIIDIASNLTKIFKKYSRNAREKAWENLTSQSGQKEIQKLLQDPNRSINTFQKLNFKEWLNHECS